MILANGFFVATEFALVSSRPTRIDQLAAAGNRAARLVQRAKSDPTRFISGTQLGVTFASLMLGWIGEDTFAHLIQNVFDQTLAFFGQPNGGADEVSGSAHAIASILALVLITFFHITLGEQVPKILALQKAEPVILFAVQPVSAMAWLIRPFISLLCGVHHADPARAAAWSTTGKTTRCIPPKSCNSWLRRRRARAAEPARTGARSARLCIQRPDRW